jgi:PUA domain protein
MINKIQSNLEGISTEFSKLIQRGIEVVETDVGVTLILYAGEPVIFKIEGRFFPTVKGALKINIEHMYVTVDKGAVPYIINGADIMRPGVVDFDKNIRKGDLVVINEENYRKPLAIGKSLWDAEEFSLKDKGKCVENLHYIGDSIWNLEL